MTATIIHFVPKYNPNRHPADLTSLARDIILQITEPVLSDDTAPAEYVAPTEDSA